MNKSELIQCLRDPSKLTAEQLAELDKLTVKYPAFLSARLVLAKVSKELKHKKAKKYIASAAIYSTDRVLLKKYLSGDLFFLTKPTEATQPSRRQKAAFAAKIESEAGATKTQEQEKIVPEKTPKSPAPTGKHPSKLPKQASKKEATTTSSDQKRKKSEPSVVAEQRQKTPKVPDLPGGSLDAILESLERDMENLKASREKFLKVQEKITEEGSSPVSDKSITEDKTPAENTDQANSPESTTIVSTKESTPAKLESDSMDDPGSSPVSAQPEVQPDKQKAISDITKQVLEAARIAKEEVAKEDKLADQVEEEVEAEIEQPEATADPANSKEQKEEEEVDKKDEKSGPEDVKIEAVTEEAIETTPLTDSQDSDEPIEEIKEKPKKQASAKKSDKPKAKDKKEPGKTKKKTTESKQDISNKEENDERAERAIREPRFSRFSSRSYLRPPAELDSTDFLDDEEDSNEEAIASTTVETPTTDETEKKPDPKETEDPVKKTEDSGIPADDKEPDVKEVQDEAPEESKKSSESASDAQPPTASKPTESGATEAQSELEKKYNLPDLSKAKAVPRKSKRKKKIAKEEIDHPEKPESSTKTGNAEVKAGEKTKDLDESSQSLKTGKIDPKEAAKGSDVKKKDTKDLIEDFIQKSPTIKYKRTEESSPEDLAQESASWDPNLASEYLAEIYLHQGNKKRAEEIYKALSLKYPEKKSYFADLIAKLK